MARNDFEPQEPARPVPAPEFSRRVPIERVGAMPLVITVEPTDEERGRIALRLGIVAVTALSVRYELRTLPHQVVEADGALCATVIQDCVVTVEPFPAPVTESFRVRFVPEAALGADEELGDPDAIDEVPYQGRLIDLGEAAVEQLALGLDPFPRSPDAPGDGGALEDGMDGMDEADAGKAPGEDLSPLAALARKWASRG